MRIWTGCLFYKNKYCLKKRKKFDGSFECKGSCFEKKHQIVKSKNDNFQEIVSGGDHVL